LIDAEHRRRAKAVNFGIVYGLSPFGLAQQLGISQKEAKRFIEAYFERYSGVRSYLDQTLEEARATGVSTTLFGRVRPIPDLDSRNAGQRGFAERTALNTPLQGSAADLIKLAMIAIDAELQTRGLRSRMLLQVHDELLFELPPEEETELREMVTDKMIHAATLRVPLEISIGVGGNWRDAK
jgi:DNA polymerase I